MEKLLHERLRKSEYGSDLLDILGLNKWKLSTWSDVFNALADEIERYYIPRPRFEDGEPVHCGDVTEVGAVYQIAIDENDDFIIYDMRMNVIYDGIGDAIKRPQQKVLDADGVEIKVGDTVWLVGNAKTKLKVIDVDEFVTAEVTDGLTIGDKVIRSRAAFTHKEPDSIARIKDDMLRKHEDWCGDPNEWLEMADRLSALIERGA